MIGLQFTGEALIRKEDGSLFFIGTPADKRREAVEHLNAGHYGQEDIDALDGLPVFDEAALDPEGENVLLIVANPVGKVLR